MSTLALNYLGDFEVLREGQPQRLPPSKKTRALLAYLSLHPRSFRREFLCELLWDIPDDPRGSLRWSLSKLRRAVDDDDTSRIAADRNSVEFVPTEVEIDVLALYELVDTGLSAAATEALEAAAVEYRGNFLEGLELSNFHDFHAWCVAEREKVLEAQAAILRELAGRFNDEPRQALPHLRRLVSIEPYDEKARSRLIRVLMRLRHTDEAEQQYRLGTRMLKEIGAMSTGELFSAWRGDSGSAPPAAPAAPRTTPAPRAVAQGAPAEIVGRERELAMALDVFTAVSTSKTARSLLIAGEPGVGKSELLQLIRSSLQAAGVLVLSARAYESESLRPFGLWIDALKDGLPEAANAVFAAEHVDNRERLFEALNEVLRDELTDRPVALVFDDVHWCDESSAAALHYLVRANRDAALMSVFTGRTAELLDSVHVQQSLRGLRRDGLLEDERLSPLATADVERLIEANAPNVDAARLARESGGNPLLAIELARAEVAGESGTSLDEIVRERLARFDVDGVEILNWAAVLSPRIDLDSLVELSSLGADAIATVLEDAERQGVLELVDSRLRFSHDLVARAVYNQVSPIRRQVMHRRVAEQLEKGALRDQALAADLAHHATQSGDAGLAARAMASAGKLCLRFFANDEAASLARKGLQLAGGLPDAERVCASIDLHNVLLSAAPLEDAEAAARLYASLAEEAVEHGELAHARLGYHMAATVRWWQGEWSAAREQSLQSERVSRGGRVEDNIAGLADTAYCLVMLERDIAQADAMLMEAEALAKNQRVNHPSLPAGLGLLRFYENELDEAENLLEEARTLYKLEGDRVAEFGAVEHLMMIDLERGDRERAATRTRQLLELGEKLREGSEGPYSRAIAGFCTYASGGEDAALEAGLEELRVVDAKHRLAYTLLKVAQMEVEQGHHEKAAARATEALGYATLLRRATEMALARMILARTCRAAGDAAAARIHEAALDELLASGIAVWARNTIAASRDRESGGDDD